MTSERRLLFRLALRLGYANPDKILNEVPWRIWQEWKQFHTVEPFDPTRDDYMSAQLAMLFANAWFRQKQTDRVWTVKDFLPKFEQKVETEQDKLDRLLNMAMDITLLMGGEIVDGNRTEAGATDSPNHS